MRRRVPRITLRFVTARPMSSRWCRPRPRSRPMADTFARRGSRWGALRTSRGGSQQRKAACAEFRWTTATLSNQRLPHRFPMPARLLTMLSKSNWRSVSSCVHCRQRERAHERRWATDFTRRRPTQGDRRCALHGRYSTRSHRPRGHCLRHGPAENAPGVLAVLTHKNMPRMKALPWSHLRPQGQTYLPLQDDQIHYAGQPVALVVAATLDLATYAGTLIKVEYEARPPVVFDLRTAKKDAIEPPQRMWPLSSSIGDANKAFAGAAVEIEQTYTMPDRHHNPMEPHATLAVWDDNGTLTLYDSTQMVVGTRKLVSLVLGVAEEKINVVCEFLGGGFGGKSWSWPHTLLAALAAKAVNRPVRLPLSRAQMYSMVGQ